MPVNCMLSNTGLGVGVAVALGALLLLLGVAGVVVFAARSRRSRGGGALVLLLVLGGVLGAGAAAGAPATPASASARTSAPVSARTSAANADACSGGEGDGGNNGGAENLLTIEQTSVNTGLAPGATASTLAGTITNHGTSGAYITRVSVSIAAVETAPDAAGGTCDGSDFVVVDSAMPVGRMLEPGDSADFGGASIALSEKGTNQDACKSATLRLHYVSS